MSSTYGEDMDLERPCPLGGYKGGRLPLGMMGDRWYYCLDHKTVEPFEGCRAEVRIGPFPTRDEAEQALDTVARRNEEWDNDPDWAED